MLVAGCAQRDGSHFTPLDLVAPSFSDDDLRQLGMDADREIQKQVEIVYDPVVAGFLNDLGQEIAGQIEPQPFIYRFRVIKASSLNAFALPGGYVYIHSETLMRVGSIDELAGVLGHEIAHVQARHFSRRESKTALPGLAARVIGMGAAVAAQQPGLAVIGEGVNVSLQIGFTREFEAEADQLGAIWVTRAGYRAAALTHFLDKIIQSEARFPDNLPPYLATHPFPEDRIHAIETAAQTLEPTREPDPALAAALPRAQQRLAELLKTGRASLAQVAPPSHDASVDARLRAADEIAAAGNREAALALLSGIPSSEMRDPRVPFRIGELLYDAKRYREAADSFSRAIELDPSRALVFFQLGLALKNAGQPQRAVYAFEQAALRTPETSDLRRRSDWEIFKLTFASIETSGFSRSRLADAIAAADGSDEAEFSAEISQVTWWARLGSRFRQYADQLRVRWVSPSGEIAQQGRAKRRGDGVIGSELDLDDAQGAGIGRWTLELVLKDEVIARQSFAIRAPQGEPPLR
jgi:predicted Zn-dependent protease